MKALHLRDLMADGDRCAATSVTAQGITVDYSRQNVVLPTMDMLFDLAEAAGVEGKKAAMARGEHINTTEDRAGVCVCVRVCVSVCVCMART
jgi:glucose-6-phosphate isomerase